jgi:hypothetical protein
MPPNDTENEEGTETNESSIGDETDTNADATDTDNSESETGGASESTNADETETGIGGKPAYEAASVYLADPELTKYRHTYFKRLELDYPQLRGCQQRELQRALLAVAMNDIHREEVRDRAVEYRERREQREQPE